MQNVRSVFLLVILAIPPLIIKAQKIPEYDHVMLNGAKVIEPTYSNLIGLTLCDESIFIKTMTAYGYEVSYNYSTGYNEAFLWIDNSQYAISIKKNKYQIFMMFTPDKFDFAVKLIEDLNRKGQVSTVRGGYQSYKIVSQLPDNYYAKFVLNIKNDIKNHTGLISMEINK
ncbi:hypothetical protein [Chitinophaga sp. MM2321]|uniref:hypothetical protein n=1 Tax=Chitinophaga sp. MM2321 TaxID=3137178 RepID=UPI0032D593A9